MGHALPLFRSVTDWGPESSVMPSGSSLIMGKSVAPYRCHSTSLSNALQFKICCSPVGAFLKVSAVRPLMGDLLI